ncbi:MAG: PilZ domain-containing protein [Myxococcota bacterium]
MTLRSTKKRWLGTFARPEAFAPRTVSILAKLGYQIASAESYDESGAGSPPDLWIADERRIGEVPDPEGGVGIPIIVLTGRHGATGADPRIVGAVQRPAGLHELYRLLQQVFEETPRSTPRVPVHLRARCRRQDRAWPGAMLSLSENGCLLRSTEPLPLGTQVNLSFELPRIGPVELWAEAAYQLVPDLGLVFSALEAADRDAIQQYVVDALAHA